MALICVIGLPRSGTTLLGRSLAALPGAQYHEEPNPMWRFKNFRRFGHEQFDANDATPDVRSYIRSFLLPMGQEPGCNFVIEKTPANCIRCGFVEAVVPEARFIFITRNGHDIRRSMLTKWSDGTDLNATRLQDDRPFRTLRAKFAKSRYIHRSEKLGYLGAEMRARWSLLRRGSTEYWGPKVKNWKSLCGYKPETVVNESYMRMQEAFEVGIAKCEVPHSVVAYERLLLAPRTELQRVFTEIGCTVPNLDPVLKNFDT